MVALHSLGVNKKNVCVCVWTSFAKDLFLWETASSNLDKGGEEQMWNVHGVYKLSLGFLVSMVNESTAA